jgi:hypothetical protein
MRGRRYRVLIEITYAGGRLPDEARDALASAIRVPDRGSSEAMITVSADPHSIVAIGAICGPTIPGRRCQNWTRRWMTP